jgi:cytosine/adenosine deaminase-related metal-dependent hydrolase
VTEPRSHRHLLVRGGTLVTMDPGRRVLEGDLLITDGRIVALGAGIVPPPATRLLEARGLFVLPGFIQAHVHLGQALFRGLAEDRPLLRWLRERIWPLEAAHTDDTAYASGLLGAADCLLSGTTTVQEFGLVRGMEGIFRAIRDSGLRAVAGKCLMDTGEGAPSALLEDPDRAVEEAGDLYRRWHGEAGGRIRGALCPRFVLSCSRAIWERTVTLAAELGAPVHTHLLESEAEEAAVRAALGTGQMEFLRATGVLDADLRVAHAVWLREPELETLGGRPLKIAHCPSANLKLGSGVADLPFLRAQANLAVGIGCDGAPCNNDMDVLEEMRLAALLQGLKGGPGSFSALSALELATIDGARAVGWEDTIGSLEAGKAGDVVVLDLDRPQTFGAPGASIYDRIVYAAARDAVRWVVVDGEIRVENGRLPHLDPEEYMRRPAEAIRELLSRVELR